MIDEKTSFWRSGGTVKHKKIAIIAFGPICLVLIGLGLYLLSGRYVETDNAYVKATKITISSESTGKVTKVHVTDNSRVKAGDALFTIDQVPLMIALRRAEADLANVRTDIASIQANYLQKQAQVIREKETVAYQAAKYERYKGQSARQSVAQDKREQVKHDLQAAKSDFEIAKQQAQALKAQLGGDADAPLEDHPRFKQSNAELEKAQLDLSRINVLAPANGVVANLDMQIGEYAVAGIPLFSVVDDTAPWIEANFKETDLTHVRVGQDAHIEVDTYPGHILHGKVLSISPATGAEFSILPAQNSSGNWVKVVQRIMVKVELTDYEDKPDTIALVSGMSALVKIDTNKTRLQRLTSQ